MKLHFNLLKSELMKCSRNVYLLGALLIVAATALLPLVFDNNNTRAIIAFDLFQTALFFVVGGIWSTEYSFLTIKNPVMSHSRNSVFVIKFSVIFMFTAILFALYSCGGVLFSNASLKTLLPQAAAVFAHTAVLLLLSQVIVSFSMFSVAALIVFFANHSLIALGESALENTFAKYAPVIIFIGSVDFDIPPYNILVLLAGSVIVIFAGMVVFGRRDLA